MWIDHEHLHTSTHFVLSIVFKSAVANMTTMRISEVMSKFNIEYVFKQ